MYECAMMHYVALPFFLRKLIVYPENGSNVHVCLCLFQFMYL